METTMKIYSIKVKTNDMKVVVAVEAAKQEVMMEEDTYDVGLDFCR